tara:strand:+ start:17918 stop:18448 length:531 start_codon:yes stop_codon:yes gene_type:complete
MARLNKTYNNIVNILTRVSRGHGMVNTVSTGDVDNIDNSGSSDYPIVHIVPTSVNTGAHSLTYNFNIIVMDLVLEDESNEQEVLSDTLMIITDIIAELRRGGKVGGVNDDYLQDNRGFTCEPFTESYDDKVSGWNCTYNIEVPHKFDACDSFNYTHDGTEFTDDGNIDLTSRDTGR